MNPRVPWGLLEGFRGERERKTTTVIVSTMNELECGFRLHIFLEFIYRKYNHSHVIAK